MNIKKWRNVISDYLLKHPVIKMLVISLVVLLVGIIVVIGIYLVSVIKKVPPDFMTIDPLQTTEFPWYKGFLSNLGVILWSISIGCTFSAAILLANNRPIAHFLIATGTLSIFLVIDDMFRFHDSFLLYRLHIPEYFTILFYGLIIFIYLFSFYRTILSDISFILLVGALLFFGISIVFYIVTINSSVGTFIKDGIKFIGIAFWLMYTFIFVDHKNQQRRSG